MQTLRIPGSQTSHLRALNLLETVFGLYFAATSLAKFVHKHRNDLPRNSGDVVPPSLISHTALNLALFPPLFFLSALYYTDVMSVVTVLHAYDCFLQQDTGRVVMYSLMALSLRQTNIFWTAVWLGGLATVRVLEINDRGKKEREKSFKRRQTWSEVCDSSWSRGIMYDPLVSEASFGGKQTQVSRYLMVLMEVIDYLQSGLSLVLTFAIYISPILSALLPYLSILFAFAGFVAWNGGVVLGKSRSGSP